MFELFRIEAENQTAVLTNRLLELEQGHATPQIFEALMRAAHSLKGAAHVIDLQEATRVAHALEDCFVAAQEGRLLLREPAIDLLFRGVDLLALLANRTEANLIHWGQQNAVEIEGFLSSLGELVSASGPGISGRLDRPGGHAAAQPSQAGLTEKNEALASQPSPATPALSVSEPADRVLRLAAENLNRLLGLAGEAMVESRWLRPFGDSLQRLKRHHTEVAQQLELLRQALDGERLSERTQNYLNELFRQLAESQQFLAGRMQELEMFDRRSAHLSQRLYLEVLRTRMRPFSDGVRRFPRMVRDLARAQGKEVKLEISGQSTQVDRDILERLETPLAHLLRNAVDHGCESPDGRRRSGKPAEATLRLEARHSAGVLLVSIADDGAGVDLEHLRRVVVQKQLVPQTVAAALPEPDLLDFLFVPGLSLREVVTDISGRGFGLDVVHNMVKGVRGTMRLINQPGRGLRVQLQLPLTLSVLRALLVEVAGEPYAMPLSQITRTLKLPRASLHTIEGRHHFQFGNQQVSLLTAHQVLDCGPAKLPRHELPVVVLGDRTARYGLAVDRFLGEREIVVQPLEPRLGKVQGISAAALMEDGNPVLIIDVDDMARSIETLISESRLGRVQYHRQPAAKPRRVLVVDDSPTVRELVRKLFTSHGYQADVAIDGMDAWTILQGVHYDLVLSDIDMPRMGGIELACLIKKDPRLNALPILIVSYKDSEEDRLRGLEAGADYYLAKGEFHDQKLLQAVADLIGKPEL